MNSSNNIINDQSELTKLYNFLTLVWKEKKFLIYSNATILLLLIIISLMLPKWYRADAKIYLEPDKSDNFAFMQLMQGIPMDLLGGGSNGLLDLNKSIVESRLFKDQLIAKFKLDSVYNFEYREDIYEALSNDVRIVDNEDGTFNLIGLYKQSPKKAKDLVTFAVQVLKNINIKISQESAKKYREFIQDSYNKSIKELTIFEDSLRAYQENYGVFDIKFQTETVIEQLAELEAQKVKLELQLEYLEKNLKANNQDIASAKTQINLLQKKISAFKNSTKYSNLAINTIPKLGLNFLRIYRDVMINQKIIGILRPQLEKAKIDEFKNIANLTVIDGPILPEKKYKPKRSIIVFFGFIVGFCFSLIAIYIKNYLLSNQHLIKSIIKH